MATITNNISQAWQRTLEAAGLTTIKQSEAYANRVYEAAVSDFEDEPPLGDVATFGYKRITSNGLRDFSKMSHDDILSTVWSLFQSNGVAKRAIAIKRDYVLGSGCQVTSEDENLREIIDTFCRINKFDQRIKKFVFDLFLFGELCLPVFIRESDGQTRLGYIDAEQIETVIAHPQNVLEPWLVICKLRSIDKSPRIYRIIREDCDFVRGRRVVPANYPEMLVTDQQANIEPWEEVFLQANKRTEYSGSCFYVSVNNVSAQLRGFSDLLQSADTLDLYDETLFALGEREAMAGYFSYDVKVTGSDEAKVKSRANEIRLNPPTKKGAINVHNESEEWTFNYPDLKAPNSIATADALKSQAANGLGQPAHWHNLDNTATRTTAESQNNPTWKTLEHDQSIIRDFIVDLFDFVRDQADIAGFWSPGGDDDAIIVNLPEVSERDTARASQTLSQAVQALSVAHLDLRVISRETVSKVIARLINELGITYDATEELEQIDSEPETNETSEAVTEFLNGNGWRH